MRNDMHKVIAERPRNGGHGVRRGVGGCRDIENLPTRMGITPRVQAELKESDDNLQPLRRYLRAQVGRLWNDVYSDICARNDNRNKVQAEVREHVSWMVHPNVQLVDGEPRDLDGHHVYRDFWVHPETGVLHEVPRGKRYRWSGWRTDWEQEPIDEKTKYVKVDGIWYRVTFKPFIDDEFRAAHARKEGEPDRIATFDVIFKGALYRNLDKAREQLTREWGAPICAVRKQQIGKKEKKHLETKLAARAEARAAA